MVWKTLKKGTQFRAVRGGDEADLKKQEKPLIS